MTITAASTVQDMEDVGIAELREHLDDYLRRIADGETLRVTDAGRTVVLLSSHRPADDSVLDRLEAEGRLAQRPPRRKGLLPKPAPMPDDGGPTLSEVLQQMRDEDDR
ncbi:MAG TPA: type II toxin-antitoxin system prevent-host-death family antitoxin [Mycobacteriales bacterium]